MQPMGLEGQSQQRYGAWGKREKVWPRGPPSPDIAVSHRRSNADIKVDIQAALSGRMKLIRL